MHDGYVAVGTTTDLRAHARELRRSWDTSFDRGAADGVRDVVADSWTRMLGAGIAPDRLRPVRALDDDHLDEVRRTSPLRTVLDDLRGCLAGLADDAEHILVVGDAAGRLLWIDGHERVLEQARAIDFVPGMDWRAAPAPTPSGPRWPSTTPCRSSPPSTSSRRSTPGGAPRRRSTIR